MSGSVTNCEFRIVGEHCSDPDGYSVVLGAKYMHTSSRFGSRHPLGCTRACRNSTIEGERQLERNVGNSGRDELRPRRDEPCCFRFAASNIDGNACSFQDLDPVSYDVWVWIATADDDATDLCVNNRFGTRRRTTVMVARLERHVECRAASSIACLPESDEFGVLLPSAIMVGGCDELAIANDRGPHVRIGGWSTKMTMIEGGRHPRLILFRERDLAVDWLVGHCGCASQCRFAPGVPAISST
jgi:hypothetical protein